MITTVKGWLAQSTNTTWEQEGDKLSITGNHQLVTIQKDGLQYGIKWNGDHMANTNSQIEAIEILDMAFTQLNIAK